MSYVYAGYSIVLATLATYALVIWRSHKRALSERRALADFSKASAGVTLPGSGLGTTSNTETSDDE